MSQSWESYGKSPTARALKLNWYEYSYYENKIISITFSLIFHRLITRAEVYKRAASAISGIFHLNKSKIELIYARYILYNIILRFVLLLLFIYNY